MSELALRDVPAPSDVALIRDLARESGGFSESEIAIAVELIEERLARGLAASGYHFLFAEWGPGVPALGYACFGPIPLTEAGWDLYWIAVARKAQGRGVGRRLLEGAERRAAALGARQMYIDTAGRADYARSRAFYTLAGYRLAATIADFYAPGDAKLIYAKAL